MDVIKQLDDLFRRGLLASSEHVLVSRERDGRFSLKLSKRVLDALASGVPYAVDDFEAYAPGSITSLDQGLSGIDVTWSDDGRTSGIIFAKSAADQCLILNNRTPLVYPFDAGDWTDLRLAVWLSLTTDDSNDIQSDLSETLTKDSYSDRFFIGFKNNDDTRPVSTGTNFIGFINEYAGSIAPASIVTAATDTSTDGGTNFWRAGTAYTEGFFNVHTGSCSTIAAAGTAISSLVSAHGLLFPQTSALAGGYAGLVKMRLTRDAGSSIISIGSNVPTNTGNLTYSDEPTVEAALAALESAPAVGGTSTLGSVPNALYFYWPFSNSRLRIHAIALKRYAPRSAP